MPTIKLDKLLSGTGVESGDSTPKTDLEKLVQRAQHMDDLCLTLCRAIGPEAASGVVSANIREDESGATLMVVCQSSAWASRLRFNPGVLREAASACGHNVSNVKVVVAQRS